jgi:site-specific DNA-methyltransferase (adenine-specific)
MTPYYQDELVTIYHGDCRDLLPSIEADVIVTDPPYGVRYSSHRGEAQWGGVEIGGDEDTEVRDLILERWGNRPAVMFYSPGRPPAGAAVHLVWDKGTGGNGNAPWPMTHECIAILHRWWGPVPEPGRAGSSVLRVTSPTLGGRGFHPTEKPVSLMVMLLLRCPPGTILDPFMGSGTTLVAAKSLNRHAIGIEIEERYCEIAARRCSQGVLGLGG